MAGANARRDKYRDPTGHLPEGRRQNQKPAVDRRAIRPDVEPPSASCKKRCETCMAANAASLRGGREEDASIRVTQDHMGA
ncbi:hypothetical protein CSOJ01_09704 [Colletotrichum sojae]|uniref:Uncharacterized protein n=1 Tax=Colletotrichum sojae TaxID=2175907 RepID=A0A8H6J276_9PEZI|nr:hypothetical protein CSOJ01_09704 [Colletotrichum sojae]